MVTPGMRGGNPTQGRAGFTIAEVMMAAAILALAISTSITTMQSAFLSLDSARNVTLASHVMQSEMERMRLNNWNTINAIRENEVQTLTIDSAIAAVTGNRGFTLTRTVTAVRTGMKKIVLQVTWRGYDGRTQSRSYTTYYGQDGLYDYFTNSF